MFQWYIWMHSWFVEKLLFLHLVLLSFFNFFFFYFICNYGPVHVLIKIIPNIKWYFNDSCIFLSKITEPYWTMTFSSDSRSYTFNTPSSQRLRFLCLSDVSCRKRTWLKDDYRIYCGHRNWYLNNNRKRKYR